MSLVSERISQHCKRLKLIHLETEWPAIAESSVKGQDSLADFLDKLLAAECAARQLRIQETMLKLATLPSIKTLEGYDFAFASGAPRKQITELGGLAFLERHDSHCQCAGAEGHPGRFEDPLCKMDKNLPKKKQGEIVLTLDEARIVWQALKDCGYPFGTHGQVQLLSACRLDEWASAEEPWVDLKEALIVIRRTATSPTTCMSCRWCRRRWRF